jgi:hypothetical protein
MSRFAGALLAALALSSGLTLGARAQDPTPWAGATECTVVPYDLTTVLTPSDATPEASSEPPAVERPSGEPADGATVRAVTETIELFVGCNNLGYPFRILFLLTPEYLQTFIAEAAGPISAEEIAELNELANSDVAAEPLPPDQQTVIVAIEDVEILEDDRVVATVIGDNLAEPTGPNPVYFVFEAVDGRYLIDDVIDPEVDGTPVA